MNSTLTLTSTLKADETVGGDRDSVRLRFASYDARMSQDVCVTYTESGLVRGMTLAVSQRIPLDVSRGRAQGFVHLRAAIITYIVCAFIGEYRKCRCVSVGMRAS